MTFELKSEDVDVDEIMRSIRKRIEEKKKGLYSDEEIQEIAEHKLTAVLDAHEFDASFLPDLEARRFSKYYEVRKGELLVYSFSFKLPEYHLRIANQIFLSLKVLNCRVESGLSSFSDYRYQLI